MSAASRWARVLVALGLVAVPVAGWSLVPVSSGDEAWAAAAWLPGGPGSPRGPGWFSRVEVVSLEAIPEVTQSRFEMGREPGDGWGIRLAWGRFWGAAPSSVDRFSTFAIRRRGRVRAGLGAALLRTEGERVTELAVRAETLTGPVLTGGWIRLHPGAEGAAPEFAVLLRGAYESWFGGVDLGPSPGVNRWALGTRLPGSLIWTAVYTRDALAFALAWRLGRSVLQAERTQHPWLGASTRISWTLGGEGR